VRADNLGSLRDHDYDFKKIWFGEKIKEVRRSIAAKECHCPLANASYTNMLHDIPTLVRVSANIIGLGTKRASNSVDAEAADGIQSERAGEMAAGALNERSSESGAMEWLNQFDHQRGKDPGYAENALAAYALGMKAKGPIVGVVTEPGPRCCEAARQLPAGKVYLPEQAPRLPLASCPQGHRCDCVYRPAMTYQPQAGEIIA